MSYGRYTSTGKPDRNHSRSTFEERLPRGTDSSPSWIRGTQARYSNQVPVHPQALWYPQHLLRDYTTPHWSRGDNRAVPSSYDPQGACFIQVQNYEVADQAPPYAMGNTTGKCDRCLACSEKTADPSVRTNTSSASARFQDLNERILNRDPLESTRNEIQRHSTAGFSDCEKNSVDVKHEERRSTQYSGDRMFVGLSNMGNSCCVNVLLQTLFMTPEYRNLIFRCQKEGILKDESNHVPEQLRKMFHRLQDTENSPASSRSFSRCLWSNYINICVQMDAEELFRSIFCLVQDQLKGTDLVADINKLYTITTEECIKCSQCEQETKQTESMLTIPLSMYDATTQKPLKNIENSLASFFEPQKLETRNMCFCDKCEERTITIKSYSKISYPQILCLQLKRFRTSAGKTEKIYDFMEFPETLNMKNFTEESYSQTSKLQYHLLSVIVHTGSAIFGHYYAYIRRFPEMDWYCFMDEVVGKATWKDVKSTFGSAHTAFSSGFERGGTAYLLFYRRME